MIGLMSGTSLDGVDLVYASFEKHDSEDWRYTIEASETVPFTDTLTDQLSVGTSMLASNFVQLDHELGVFFGNSINRFIERFNILKSEIHAIATHGQTIFHQPGKGYTSQIGNPAVIAHITQLPTIGDFRTKDVLYGGQGAPLVPIGDKYLFGKQHDAFLNIGGFSNISLFNSSKIVAYDVTPGNLPLNLLARSKGLTYDKNGELASEGTINFFLLDLLNELSYYTTPAPKSLGVEWLEQHFYPLLKFDKDIESNLATVVEHIAIQIGKTLEENQVKSVLITGGGAKNVFLMNRLKRYYSGEVTIPNDQLIDFKEALIFGLLGVLFLAKEHNCLADVTGASKNVIGGVLHLP